MRWCRHRCTCRDLFNVARNNGSETEAAAAAVCVCVCALLAVLACVCCFAPFTPSDTVRVWMRVRSCSCSSRVSVGGSYQSTDEHMYTSAACVWCIIRVYGDVVCCTHVSLWRCTCAVWYRYTCVCNVCLHHAPVNQHPTTWQHHASHRIARGDSYHSTTSPSCTPWRRASPSSSHTSSSSSHTHMHKSASHATMEMVCYMM